MSVHPLYKNVQANFVTFWTHLSNLNQDLNNNPFTRSLSIFQSMFVKAVRKVILSPVLWQVPHLLPAYLPGLKPLVFTNVPFPMGLEHPFRLNKDRKFIAYDPAVVTLFQQQPIELTHICNFFTLLSVWQISIEMKLKYCKNMDQTSFLYQLFPLGNLSPDTLSFFMHVSCKTSIYKLCYVLNEAKQKNRPDITTCARALFDSPLLKEAIALRNWETVHTEIEKYLSPFIKK